MMNLEHDLVFCYIEEDNVQRAHFRVRPLLTVHGDVQEEAAKLWPDDGCLRIVPDRNEQHTFKERMRTLGGFCVMNLLGIPADANKIRTNKNYKPERGEKNQFILYSDTVQLLPEHTFFEVIEASPDEYASAAAKAVTPLFYLQDGDTLYGPVHKSNSQRPEPAKEAEGTLYSVACPDEKERVLLCIPQPVTELPKPAPAAEEKPASTEPAPAQEDAALPIGKPLQILDQNKNFEETLQGLDQPLSKGANLLHQNTPAPAPQAAAVQDKPLTGTPLFRANMRTSVPQPKNKLQEVVAAQWRVARNEPPTAPLPAGAKMHQVENPVEVACTSMKAAWQVPEAQNQLINLILSLDGMRPKLETRMTEDSSNSPLQKALHARLQDMEAERLAVLLQLDKAKADLDGLRRSAVENLSAKTRAEYDRLSSEKDNLATELEALKTQQNALIAQRDELLTRIDALQGSELPAALAKAMADARIAAPVEGIPLRMSPVSGKSAAVEDIIRRVMDAFAASGVAASRNHAVAMLALLAASKRIGLLTSSPASAATLMGNIARYLGWEKSFAHQVTPEQKPVLAGLSVDATPAVLLTSLAAYAPLENITKVFLARNAANHTRNVAFEASSWPILQLPELGFVPEIPAAGEPVSMAAVQAMGSESNVTMAEVQQVLAPLLAKISPLSGAAMREMHSFIAACTPWMEGSFAAACDWAISLWILPCVDHHGKAAAALKPLLEEYPRSLARI